MAETVETKRVNTVEESKKNKESMVNKLTNQGIMGLKKDKVEELIKKVKSLLDEIQNTDAQDILIVENETLEVKIKGVLTEAKHLPVWDREVFNYFVGTIAKETVHGRELPPNSSFLDTKCCEKLLEHHDMSHDFTVSLGEQKSLRTHMYSVYKHDAPNKQALAIAIRVVNREIPSWDSLNLPEFFRGVTKQKSGLVLVAGHVGSGKSTTVASLVRDINLSGRERRSVVTIEQPIEYVHRSSAAKIVQKSVGINTPSFGRATEDAMRENADIIVIGELRTEEDMDNALRLVEIGKLVLATIHSNSVVDTPDRYVNMFRGDAQVNARDRLASNIICIMHQNLETVEGKQYPSVEGFFVRNDTERSTLQKNFMARSNLTTYMKEAKPTVVTKEKSFEELKEKIEFNDVEAARTKLAK